MKPTLTISPTIQRQFILGKQGLWPGRRWAGKTGVAQAIRETHILQIDPVSILAPSHELVLWGRVLDFQPDMLHELLYKDRLFFDYGGWLGVYPMEELPYFRLEMEQRKAEPRWKTFAEAHPELLELVRQELRARGPLRSRDIEGQAVNHYRAGKDTGVALFYLWLTGKLMTCSREGKERVYDFLEHVAPVSLQYAASPEETRDFIIRKAIFQNGIVKPRDIRNQARLAEWVETGELVLVQVEGEKKPCHLFAKDLPSLEALQNGQVPAEWRPMGATTQQEVVFLSPLEYVSARGRAKRLFQFDYIWEIYKPEPQRKYGPYTLPILYGDQLVGRVDMKLDRPNQLLRVNGFWLEPWFAPDEAFALALANGLARMMKFLGASHLNGEKLDPAFLRTLIAKTLNA